VERLGLVWQERGWALLLAAVHARADPDPGHLTRYAKYRRLKSINLEFAVLLDRKLQVFLGLFMWKWNVGQFFSLLGILLLVLYFATSQGDSPIVYYFCFGVIFVLFGAYMMWIGRNPPIASDRFHSIRRMSEKKKKPKKDAEK
jgi:hypothetical protein